MGTFCTGTPFDTPSGIRVGLLGGSRYPFVQKTYHKSRIHAKQNARNPTKPGLTFTGPNPLTPGDLLGYLQRLFLRWLSGYRAPSCIFIELNKR